MTQLDTSMKTHTHTHGVRVWFRVSWLCVISCYIKHM